MIESRQPLVSILIPAYNAERSLAETLGSVAAQTWKKTEVIVIDDGSRDRTASIARGFSGANVRTVVQPHLGAAAARNKAFSLSQGDYVQWLDADDLLHPAKIEKQIQALDQCSSRTLLSSAWGRFYNRPDRAIFRPTSLWCDLSPVEFLLRKTGQNAFMQTATWLVSRKLTELAGPWDIRLSLDDDGEYFCRVMLASDGIHFVPESKVFYRKPGFTNLSIVDQSRSKLDSLFLSMQLHIGYLRSLEDSERSRAACVKYLQSALILFYPQRPDILQRLSQLAFDLGGRLEVPRVSWKYAWIQTIFGWRTAKCTQRSLRNIKASFLGLLDRAAPYNRPVE